MVPNRQGTAWSPYTGPDAGALTVGGELNKVAANIAIGRNMAGVHWRTDYSESVTLGEEVAIGILRGAAGDLQRGRQLHPHEVRRHDGHDLRRRGKEDRWPKEELAPK